MDGLYSEGTQFVIKYTSYKIYRITCKKYLSLHLIKIYFVGQNYCAYWQNLMKKKTTEF